MDANEVQIFGVRKSADTRKALRFFSERRIRAHFVDLMERPPSPGELRRFVQKFGMETLLNRDSRQFHALGLGHAVLSEDRWIEKIASEPLILRLPLVRSGTRLAVGAAEAVWKSWLEQE
jgi:arsenate reductase-like glutaredoxin family protein